MKFISEGRAALGFPHTSLFAIQRQRGASSLPGPGITPPPPPPPPRCPCHRSAPQRVPTGSSQPVCVRVPDKPLYSRLGFNAALRLPSAEAQTHTQTRLKSHFGSARPCPLKKSPSQASSWEAAPSPPALHLLLTPPAPSTPALSPLPSPRAHTHPRLRTKLPGTPPRHPAASPRHTAPPFAPDRANRRQSPKQLRRQVRHGTAQPTARHSPPHRQPPPHHGQTDPPPPPPQRPAEGLPTTARSPLPPAPAAAAAPPGFPRGDGGCAAPLPLPPGPRAPALRAAAVPGPRPPRSTAASTPLVTLLGASLTLLRPAPPRPAPPTPAPAPPPASPARAAAGAGQMLLHIWGEPALGARRRPPRPRRRRSPARSPSPRGFVPVSVGRPFAFPQRDPPGAALQGAAAGRPRGRAAGTAPGGAGPREPGAEPACTVPACAVSADLAPRYRRSWGA